MPPSAPRAVLPAVASIAIVLAGGCAAPGAGTPVAAQPQPRGPAALVRLGDDTRRAGDTDGALGFYRSALGQDPRDVEAFEHMGALLNEMHDADRAEQAFRAALVVEPDSARARQGLAVALLSLRRPGEALPILQLLAEGSRNPQVLRNYGVALDQTGRPQQAQAAYRLALVQSPADPALHGNLALSLAIGGDLDAALSEIRAAVASPLPDPRQDANAVLVFALAGREAEARQYGRPLGPRRLNGLLSRARTARALEDAGERAMALGLMSGSP